MALAVLGAAEAKLGMFEQAATHFAAARRRAIGSNAALWAVHEGLAWERLGQRDSAASAFAAAQRAGLPTIAPWLRLREARVVSDTARAARLLADLPAARDAGRSGRVGAGAARDGGLARRARALGTRRPVAR